MTKLSDLQIDEVSLVRKGANQHAHVAIAKSADGDTGGTVETEIFDAAGNPLDPEDLEFGDVVYGEDGTAYQYSEADDADTDDDADEFISDDVLVGKALKVNGKVVNNRLARGALLGGMRAPGRVSGAARRGVTGAKRGYITAETKAGQGLRNGRKTAVAGLSAGAGQVKRGAGNVANVASGAQNAVAGFARSNKGQRTMGAALFGGAAAGGGYAGSRVGKSFSDQMEVELSKALTDDDRDAVISKAFGVMDQLADEVSKAQEMAEAEREARLETEFLEVAKSYTLPVDTELLAYALREAAELLSDESVQVIQKCLEVASDAIEMEYGASGGGDNSDIMAQVNAQVAKFDGSPADIVTKAFEDNPEAYDEYLAGN